MLKSPEPIPDLSRREAQVARAYAKGASYKDIASDLGISPATVRTHLTAIFRKLDVSNKVELLNAIQVSDRQAAQKAEPSAPARRRIRWWPGVALAVCAVFAIAVSTSLMDADPQPAPVAVAFDGPSIAVLPIDVDGGTDAERATLDAINRDIVTDLSQFSDIFVIGAGTTFRPEYVGKAARAVGEELGVRYVLSGTAAWAGGDVRVNLQLLETETARVVWSERFASSRDALLDLQTQVSTRVISLIGPVETGSGQLRSVELVRITRRATSTPSAYDLFIQGVVHWERFTAEDNARAYDVFKQAIEADPSYGKAYAMAAWTRVSDVWNMRVDDPKAAMKEARDLLDQGFAVDPNEPYMHWALGGYHLFSSEHDRAIAAFRKAVELNPNGADLRMYLGWSMVYAGQPAAGLEEMEVAKKLNPRHPGWYLWDIAFAHVFLGNYAEAVDTLEARHPKSPGTYELLSISYALAGNDQKAAEAVERLLEVSPGFTLAGRAQLEPFINPGDREKYFNAMLAAGIPET